MDFERLYQRDPAAWRSLMDEYSSNVYSAVIQILRGRTGKADTSDVEDVVADVFVRLLKDDFRLLRQYDPGKAPFHHWIAMVARSMTLNFLRAQKSTVDIDEVAEPAVESPAVAPYEEKITLPEGVVSEREALVLRLSFDDGLSSEEIASFIGIGEQSVRNYRHRAISKLRDHLGVSKEIPPDSG